MNDMPCINCLTFMICKDQIINRLITDTAAGSRASIYRSVNDTLIKKCCLLKRFLDDQYLLITHDNESTKLYFIMTADIINDVFKLLENVVM